MRIVHLVCTAAFAGVERYAARLAVAQHAAGHEVAVLGGDTALMRTEVGANGIHVCPAPTVRAGVGALVASMPADIVHVHMTAAEAAALLCLPARRVPVVSTRHFACPRGRTPGARLAGPAIRGRIAVQIAISRYVAAHIDGSSVVVHTGVPERPAGPSATERDRVILVAQRLEAEKDTAIALRAFAITGLAAVGWELHVAGGGSQRDQLRVLARDLGVGGSVRFLGHQPDAAARMASAALFVATCPTEGLGMAVLEAMSSGTPVVAAASGGHSETVGAARDPALFPPGDVETAALLLVGLAMDPARRDRYGSRLRDIQQRDFTLSAQAERIEAVYRGVL